MKPHVKIYFSFFGFGEQDFVPCEVHWNEGITCRAVDIMHIDAKGMGGNPSGSRNTIENLMAGCRAVHAKHGDIKTDKEWLKEIHLRYMKTFQRTISENKK